MSKKRISTRSRTAKWAGKIVDWQKRTVDRAMKALDRVQDRTEKLIQDVVDRSKWLPDEGKQVVAEWIKTAKKGRTDIRRAVDVSFVQAAGFCKRIEANVPAPAKAKKAARRADRAMARKPALVS
jgi:hypothetical protein